MDDVPSIRPERRIADSEELESAKHILEEEHETRVVKSPVEDKIGKTIAKPWVIESQLGVP